MNHDRKQGIVARANQRRGAISDSKGPEYTGAAGGYKSDEANVLANFYFRAERSGQSVFSVAQVYAGKHIDSLETALRLLGHEKDKGNAYDIVLSGEGLVSRLDDLRNYCDLIECILAEENLHPEHAGDLPVPLPAEEPWSPTEHADNDSAASSDPRGWQNIPVRKAVDGAWGRPFKLDALNESRLDRSLVDQVGDWTTT